MVKKILSLLAVVFITLSFAYAQSGTAVGTIVDGDGLPLIGANVVVKGTTIGTITDIDGNYKLTGIPVGNQVLLSSFIGFTNIEKPITMEAGKEVKVDFILIEDISQLDELIVIGYGTQKKEDKTGAVAHITADELNGGSLSDPLQALAGKAAGVVVTKGGGDPNSDVKIKIRGSSGISGKTDTNPLYVIDGIPGADPSMIAPEDIATFSILKDAASTAIYGSRGANGVILITTKRGSVGAAKINFNYTTSLDMVSKRLDLFSADDYRTFANYIKGDDWTDGGASTDWQDEIFRTGITQNYNLSASGGTEKSNYFASVTHSNWEGVINGSGKERTIGKLNVTHKGLNDKLTLTGGLTVAFEKNELINYEGGNKENVLYQAYQRNPTDPVLNPDGSIAFEMVSANRGFNYINPVGIIESIDKNDTKKKIMGIAKADYEIINGLVASTNLSYISKDKEYKYFRPVGVYGGQGEDDGAASRWYEVDLQKSFEATLTYSKSIDDLHNITALVGYTWQENSLEKFGVDIRNSQSPTVGYNNLESFIDVNHGDVKSEARISRLIGFFGRAQYNFESKYYASASLRRDGSSKFGDNNKWGFFPTASLAWNLHKEGFMDNLGWLDQLKLRTSFGVSGNQAFDPYFSKTLYRPTGGVSIDPITGDEVLVWVAERNKNENLKWEQTTEINTGLDFAFINSKLSGTFEYYSKTTNDLINEYNVPQGKLEWDRLWANSATILNEGMELFVSYYALDNTNLKWKTAIAVSKNSSKVTELGEYWSETTDGRKGWLSGDGMVGGDNWTIYIEEDQPLGNFYLYEFAYIQDGDAFYKNNFKENPDEEDFLRADDEGLDNLDRKIKGNATPDIELSWSNNLTFYKNITLDFSFRALLGQQVYNHTRGYFATPNHIAERNLVTEAADYVNQDYFDLFKKPTDLFLEDASFLRLDYISLGYNFNFDNNNYFKSLKLSISSNNLFVITKYSGSDPEMTIDGLDYGVDNFNVYPKTRTFSFGVNATF
ncbi:MAG: SusC/RagA family TonB-linked outer membrane protein [Salinivirgaceae bacterium]|nr:SusC/RagA family TonB-linked outer membrane protein [Salinivirgaceae bacterium]